MLIKFIYFFISILFFVVQAEAFCEVFIRQYEQKYGIPNRLLSAISLIESGQRKNGQWVAWPWSINANGISYIFDTKEEAVNKVKELRAQGITSIDVGCMQINLKHHPNAFKSVEEAFDPEKNIAYAATFLNEKRSTQGDWKNAVAHYHSATTSLNEPYKEKVLGTWKRILGQQDIPNAYDMVNKPAIVRVPVSSIGYRVNPVNIRFSPFSTFEKVRSGRNRISQEGKPSIYSIKHSKGLGRVKIISRERRIPINALTGKSKNPHSISNSLRVIR